MLTKYRIGFLVVIIATVLSCQKEVEIPAFDNSSLLVVDGVISDKIGRSVVRLGTSTNLEGIGSNTLGTNARVTIVERDSENQQEFIYQFVEDTLSPGDYYPDGFFAGIPNNSYQLRIQLDNGDEYESAIQTLFPANPVKSISYEFIETTVLDENGIEFQENYHDVFVTIDNSPSKELFYRIRATGIAEIATNLTDGQTDTTCYSFRDPINNQSVVFSNQNYPADSEITPRVASIPFDFRMRYLAQVEILSINKESFEFWEKVSDQQRIQGSIFDPFLPEVIGNISSVTNPSEKVLGFFEAHSVASGEIMIDRSQYGSQITPLEEGVCIEVWAPATYTIPDQFIR